MSEDDLRLDEELRGLWSEAPRTSPREAARQVVARIPPRPPRRPLALYAYAAAAAVVALLALRLRIDRVENAPVPPAAAPTAAVAPLPDNVVLWWIDPETPVYFAIAPPDVAQGGGS